MKKLFKILPILLVIAIALALPLCANASGEKSRVIDGAELLSDGEAAKLSERLNSLSEKYKTDIVIATSRSLNGMTRQAFADKLWQDKGFAPSSVILVVHVPLSGSRYYESFVYGDAQKVFSHDEVVSLEDDIFDYMKGGNYAKAFDTYADGALHIMKYDKRLTPIWILISLAVGAVAGGITIGVMSSKLKTVRAQRAAASYMRPDTFNLTRERDVYLYSHVTMVARPRNNSSRSGGGRSGGFGGGGGGIGRGSGGRSF